MLSPKKTKFKKQFKGLIKGKTSRGNKLIFGTFGLKSMEISRLNAKQIEATRRIITKKMKRLGFLWVRIFPDTPITSKPVEVRMGKGKGAVDFWAAKIKEGQILFEISGVPASIALQALNSGSKKLCVKTKIISRAYSLIG